MPQFIKKTPKIWKIKLKKITSTPLGSPRKSYQLNWIEYPQMIVQPVLSTPFDKRCSLLIYFLPIPNATLVPMNPWFYLQLQNMPEAKRDKCCVVKRIDFSSVLLVAWHVIMKLQNDSVHDIVGTIDPLGGSSHTLFQRNPILHFPFQHHQRIPRQTYDFFTKNANFSEFL